MLKINDLKVQIDQKDILKHLDLEVHEGQIHAIMGPNGSGKSTLAKTIAGDPHVRVTGGNLQFEVNGKLKDLSGMNVDMRAKEGLFASLQHPLEIQGLSNFQFLSACFKALCLHKGVSVLSEDQFRQRVLEKAQIVDIDHQFLDRSVNEGFSGGEKKKNEILQMMILEPKLVILDEIDSGLDIDALKAVSHAIKKFKSPKKALILITHYQRILKHIQPDYVHILWDGRIIKTGDEKLAHQIEDKGYESLFTNLPLKKPTKVKV